MNRPAESEALFAEALGLMPGGVNSPVRAFGAVGGTPLFAEHGEGAHLFDVDGNRYVDLLGSWGPLILGHAHPAVVDAVERAVKRGLSFGMPSPDEVALARMIVGALPGIDRVRMVNSGTEATMSAVRLARAFTGRDKIIKTEGGYHGHADAFLVAAGSGATTFGTPTSPGVTANTVRDSIVIPFNDPSALEAALEANRGEVACLIIEPIAGNMGTVPPNGDYLRLARELTKRHGTLLVFDEVITGFRVGWGGAQERLGVIPDLTTLGKIIGGGMPVGAYGGRRDIMDLISPRGPVYQAGTLSGNPVAMAAGRATLEVLAVPGFYGRLERTAARLFEGLRAAAGTVAPGALSVNSVASMGTLFFSGEPVTDLATARRADTSRYGRWFHGMLQRGVYLPPAQFECLFVSSAHVEADIDRVLTAASATLKELASS